MKTVGGGGVGVGDSVGETEVDADALPLLLALRVADVVPVPVVLADGVMPAVELELPVTDVLALIAALRVPVGVTEGVGSKVPEFDVVIEAEGETVNELVALSLTVNEGEADELIDSVIELVAVPVGVLDAAPLTEPLTVRDDVNELEPLADALVVEVQLVDELLVMETLADTLTLILALIDGEALDDRESVDEAVSDGDGETLGVAEMHSSGGVTVARASPPRGPMTVETVVPSEHDQGPTNAKPDMVFACVQPVLPASAYV